ncbi:MAG: hypothetical protein JF586_18275 [Burkholderiales bacterium]|nr:hypothetical protein [Burkholderiales bacterium]
MTSRAPPPRFEPCAFEGVRYEAEYATTNQAPRTRSGGVVAHDEASGRKLWSVTLWTTVDDDSGLSIPPRYLQRITRGASVGELRVEDEHGVVYHLDLASRAVRREERATRRPAPGRSD